jgi:hypothetical protein
MRRLVVCADVRLDFDDPACPPAICVVPDEAGPQQGARGLERGPGEEFAIEGAGRRPIS